LLNFCINSCASAATFALAVMLILGIVTSGVAKGGQLGTRAQGCRPWGRINMLYSAI